MTELLNVNLHYVHKRINKHEENKTTKMVRVKEITAPLIGGRRELWTGWLSDFF